VKEVCPEYSVEGGRVDYCLTINGRNSVFLEAKRINEDLNRHEKQLLDYAFKCGVDIAILTNGVVWWLYLPLARGNWADRKFLSINITEQNPQEAASKFKQFLLKENIRTGCALKEIKEIHDSKERNNVIQKTIPIIIKELFMDADEDFMEFLSNKVESRCGYRPDVELLANFIRQTELKSPMDGSSFVNSRSQVPGKEDVPKLGHSTEGSVSHRESREKGVVVKLDNLVIKAKSVSDMYLQALRHLVDSGLIKKIALPYATSGKRYLLSQNSEHPAGNPFVVPIEYKGYCMEAHKDYKNALSHLKNMLDEVGILFEY
jgi:hypothetical protein